MKDKCFSKKVLSDYYYGGIENISFSKKIYKHILQCKNCKEYINTLNTISSFMPKENIGNIKIDKHNIINTVASNNINQNKKKWYYFAASIAAIILLIFTISITNLDNFNDTKKNAEKISANNNSDFDFAIDILMNGSFNFEKLFSFFFLSKSNIGGA